MILNLNIKRGFSFKPFIGVPKALMGTVMYDVIVAHENAHYGRQRLFPLFWVIKYFMNRSFRLDEELFAYRVQIVKMKELGLHIDIHLFAQELSTQYWGMVEYERVLHLLKSIS